MDYTSAANYVTDSQGRRQYADRDIVNGVPGTSLLAADLNAVTNTLIAAMKAYGITPNAADDTLLAQAIAAAVEAEDLRASTVESNLQSSKAAATDLQNEVTRAEQKETALATSIQDASGPWNTATASGTVVTPAWATRLEIWMTGGGGGGAGCQGTSISGAISGAGGGAAATVYAMLSVTSGAAVALSVGSGGAGGAGTAAAAAGGASAVSVNGTILATANGGGGATWYSANGSAGASGGDYASEASAGVLQIAQIKGGSGGDGQGQNYVFAGGGAPSHWGGGGRAGAGGGIAGVAWGAGGGGAYDVSGSGTVYSGGAGAGGAIMYRFLP
ncbi:glycine-rich domain-containing protein [Gluconacetobacter diazotrophicus]|uniref:Glycine-rich domain-containing protein n=1 Tax=Gluconacetobacter diazotrophicus (strain ATCC 49037 / DSM 5601 / CCUG 37298 / CIP 103539 / LMG 7603 / PAl5) TaxID=272568 RepID=A9HP72_GLUDA|nr:hypothetical protein [Gluconacetobacter diazotrophicus]CAP56552.1 conserved hypothetical protein [Gluconacetobacter diazotrophicus PA1 5]